MRRGLIHAMAWSLATGAAVTLSWWGVHTVMAGTAYDPPRALPLQSGAGAEPLVSATQRPENPPSSGKPSKSHKPSGKPSKPTPSKSSKPGTKNPEPPPSSSSSSSASSSASAGNVKSYNTDGGRVVFDIGEDSATLVSATPASGWSVQVWKQESWIRVEFTGGAAKVSVFCTWHDHKPMVEIDKY
ncbi:hypothetical protein [Streptomyces sp. NPDC059009]|uniref:hypothetical protein n=1 Tax=Streptomyces sp. NPDC059009 TaxID=3346694 RepID=UPI003681EAD9